MADQVGTATLRRRRTFLGRRLRPAGSGEISTRSNNAEASTVEKEDGETTNTTSPKTPTKPSIWTLSLGRAKTDKAANPIQVKPTKAPQRRKSWFKRDRSSIVVDTNLQPSSPITPTASATSPSLCSEPDSSTATSVPATSTLKKRNSKVLELSATALSWLKRATAESSTSPTASSPSEIQTIKNTETLEITDMADQDAMVDKPRGLRAKMPTLRRMRSSKVDKKASEQDDFKGFSDAETSDMKLQEGDEKQRKREWRLKVATSMISLRSKSPVRSKSPMVDDKPEQTQHQQPSNGTLKRVKNAMTWSGRHHTPEVSDETTGTVVVLERKKTMRRALFWRNDATAAASSEDVSTPPVDNNDTLRPSSPTESSKSVPVVVAVVESSKPTKPKSRGVKLWRSKSVESSKVKNNSTSEVRLDPITADTPPPAAVEPVVDPIVVSTQQRNGDIRGSDEYSLRNRPRRSYDSSMHTRPSNEIDTSSPVPVVSINGVEQAVTEDGSMGISRDEFKATESSATLVDETTDMTHKTTVSSVVVEETTQVVTTEVVTVITSTTVDEVKSTKAAKGKKQRKGGDKIKNKNQPKATSNTSNTSQTPSPVPVLYSPELVARAIAERRDSLDVTSPPPPIIPAFVLERREVRLNKRYPATHGHGDDVTKALSISSTSSIKTNHSGHTASKSPSPVEKLMEMHTPPGAVKMDEPLINLLDEPISEAFTHVSPIKSPVLADLMELIEPVHPITSIPVAKSDAVYGNETVLATVESSQHARSPIIDQFDPIMKTPEVVVRAPVSGAIVSPLVIPALRRAKSITSPIEGYPASMATTPSTPSPSTPFPNTPSETRTPVSVAGDSLPSILSSNDTDSNPIVMSLPKTSIARSALSEYLPSRNDEMMVSVGDFVDVTAEFSDGWAMGHNQTTGQKGVFPLVVFEESSTSDELDDDEDDDQEIEQEESESVTDAHPNDNLIKQHDHSRVLDETHVELDGESSDEGTQGDDEESSQGDDDEGEYDDDEDDNDEEEEGDEEEEPRQSPNMQQSSEAVLSNKRTSTFGYIWSSLTARASPVPSSSPASIKATPTPEPSIRYVKKVAPETPERDSGNNLNTIPALLSTLPLLYVHYDHIPTRPDELSLRVGDVVNIEAAYADGWGYGHLHQFDSDIIKGQRAYEKGWVPICYLDEHEPEILGSSDEMANLDDCSDDEEEDEQYIEGNYLVEEEAEEAAEGNYLVEV
ncbi:hypothetical protein SmJEL517_g01479 [Synchytrium microbalum]|uniref:SH3 domain-containing protein n=1 Tax=Synchytrium microbalum TaxID=1806994 RepID=A0A507CDY2_9FUNG|nr:uncharacterized protein SmJEL517_g01479 [Synchytrium microbalum]TPX36124.1 hypothetical protein SmJEL517_g01479 [Synchytrium microbalum]